MKGNMLFTVCIAVSSRILYLDEDIIFNSFNSPFLEITILTFVLPSIPLFLAVSGYFLFFSIFSKIFLIYSFKIFSLSILGFDRA